MDAQPQQQPHRLTAAEARKKYGIRAAILLAATIWFAYDGWFNPNIEAKTFNKVGAVLLAAGFLFCAVMTASAHLAVRREQQQQTNAPDEQPPVPPA